MEELRSKKGFICDMDGVIYHGNRLLPGVKEFVDWLYREKKHFLFLTNSSERFPEGASAEAQAHGAGRGRKAFLHQRACHGKVHQQAGPGSSAYVIGGVLIMALHDAGITMNDVDPDYVIIGEGNNYNYENILKAVRLVMRGAKLIGTNSDLTGPSEEGHYPRLPRDDSADRDGHRADGVLRRQTEPLMMRTGLRILGVHSGGGRHDRRLDGHGHGRRDRDRP